MDGPDNQDWRPLLHELPESPSQETTQARARSLFELLKGKPGLVDDIVGELLHQSEQTPRKIDSLLSVYAALAKLCHEEPTIKSHGFQGAMALHKAFDAEMLEISQTAGLPIDDYHPYDVTCPISSNETPDAAIRKIIGFAEARRHWMIVHVLNGRSRALGVGQEAHVQLPLEEEFTLTMIRGGLGLDSRAAAQDETNFLGALFVILSAGQTLKARATRNRDRDLITVIEKTLVSHLRTETNFKFKFFIAHALESLKGDGEEWPSTRIFDEATWIH
ncbi:hypothetical protein M422DRAFT_67479 [Sphaerobolus stellatus SS14]|uniref:Uncharacterized protein n=1 Tax=Sphaerobolus stellatus (strain SS14) TaxID=990650 RepID=A0A0C9W0Z9_SPHS4|nr:hypothetical protein M422DRAFT_67479 [Sphaerobolus stellatus SS14]